MNLQEISEDDRLLGLMRHRAKASLWEQYRSGVGDEPGDAAFIEQSMRVNDARNSCDRGNALRYWLNIFSDNEEYVKRVPYPNRVKYEEAYVLYSGTATSGKCLRRSIGDLVLRRQHHMLQSLNALFVNTIVIDTAYKRAKAVTAAPIVPTRRMEEAMKLFSDFRITYLPEKLTVQDILGSAIQQKESSEDVLSLCRTEPSVLYQMVSSWLVARPELVPDYKGQRLPVTTDKYISISVFDMVHGKIAGVAIWDYICRLLKQLIDQPDDQILKAIALQELATVCHMEYCWVWRHFKHSLQLGPCQKHLERVPGGLEDGVTLVKVKDKPEVKRDPQTYYLLSLCQESEATPAISLIKKLDELHQTDPATRGRMRQTEFEAFSDLAVTASFILHITSVVSLPTKAGRKGQIYKTRWKALDAELQSLKEVADLSEFVVPTTNLFEKKNANGAMDALDEFILDKAGTKLEFLYQDMIEECLENIRDYHEQQQSKVAQKKVELPPCIPSIETLTPKARIELRREKDKTRPAHSSFFHAPTTPIDYSGSEEEITRFKVRQDTPDTFSVLFSRGEARGSIHWADFEAAMVDLGFSVIPKFGSVFTFLPPAEIGAEKVEGVILLIFASRLRKVYKWGIDSFEVG
ncbi:hypothetical protein DL98DRAFT_614758 [Cadophora sp. DSE1049]|nr:hypothetical protein DL98DRAFT_614758 [Cadophora sp. DSE1049]